MPWSPFKYKIMRVLIIGKTSFNVETLKGVSKEDFAKTHAGLGLNIDEAYEIVQGELNQLEDVRKPEKKSK